MRQLVIGLLLAAVAAGLFASSRLHRDDTRAVLNYEKGVYLGRPDQPLAPETVEALRGRAAYQAGLEAGAGGAGTPGTGASVRPPAPSQRGS
jgi:hypothetical protein